MHSSIQFLFIGNCTNRQKIFRLIVPKILIIYYIFLKYQQTLYELRMTKFKLTKSSHVYISLEYYVYYRRNHLSFSVFMILMKVSKIAISAIQMTCPLTSGLNKRDNKQLIVFPVIRNAE